MSTVLVADDHPVVRERFVALINRQLVFFLIAGLIACLLFYPVLQ